MPCSFPLRKEQGIFETDPLGELPEAANLLVVEMSVFLGVAVKLTTS
jgi:hypothetical protein